MAANVIVVARAALASCKPRVPEGYALVPIEPTDDMIDAGYDVLGDDKKRPWHWSPREMYAAMCAAAPAHKGEG